MRPTHGPGAQTIVGSVSALLATDPQRLFARLHFRQREPFDLSYEALWRGACRFASLLRGAGVRRQQVVVLVLEHGPELLWSFLGAQLLGAIPSIFAFPSARVPEEVYARTLPLLLDSCGCRFLVSDQHHLERFSQLLSERRSLALIDARHGALEPEATLLAPLAGDELAVLQHSSGTTGLKKGVMLTDRSVIAQLRNYAQALHLDGADRIASWLPLYHDMGLLACLLLPMVCGVPVQMASPFHWVTDPTLLLEIIAAERCTLCWQPNFAYNFLAARVPQGRVEGLDLSCMRAFINCAEPISAQSHDLFLQRFASNGVRPEMLGTCYAMAENTFAVTQGGIDAPLLREAIDLDLFQRDGLAHPAGAESRRSRQVVASGSPIAGNQLRIVDQQRRDLPERQVGEVAIRSDSMLAAYHNRPDLTAEAVQGGWYYTGDLGYLAQGQLFVTGRKKDMIIVAGKNIYPQDVEELVSEIDGVHPGRVVAFGLYDSEQGTEQLVVQAEVKSDDDAVRARIRLTIASRIRHELECVARQIHLLPHRTLLKSSSGKISRAANRQRAQARGASRPPASGR